MLSLQLELNNKTNGFVWLNGKTNEGRVINWHRCIYMEAVEALDSFNWKHWKDINSLDDMDNIKVELVDIWHFIMSEIIRTGSQEFAKKYAGIPTDFDREELINSLERIINLASDYTEITEICDEFFNALSYCGMSVDELYKRYIVKNILNTFRQDHGYKDGTYQKIWAGKEDNEVAFGMMEQNPNISPKALYEQLERAYSVL